MLNISLSLSPSTYQMVVRAQHKGDSGESSGLQESCEPSSPLCDICSDAQQNRASAAIVRMAHHSLPFTAILLHGLSSTRFLLTLRPVCLFQPEWLSTLLGEVTGHAQQPKQDQMASVCTGNDGKQTRAFKLGRNDKSMLQQRPGSRQRYHFTLDIINWLNQ